MSGFASKVVHVLRTEGLGSLIDRTQRYARYRLKRGSVDVAPVIREWEELKGRYAGKRAFLLGNGPSLNLTELYLLRDEATMCFNRFDLMLERLNWLPTFYTTIDDRVLLDTIEVVNEMTALSEHAFLPDIHPYCVDFRPLIEKRENVHWLFLDRTTFSADLPYCGINKTVANVGLQILGYLGFTEIYLLGVDMTYNIPKGAVIENARDITATEDDDDSHFDPRYFGKGSKFHVPMLDEAFLKFEEAYEFFEPRGVRVRNSTVGGALEAFPRVSLDEVLGLDEHGKRQVFESMVNEKLVGSLDVLDAVSSARIPESETQISSEWDVFRIPSEKANRAIMKCIFDFVPFGPLDGWHLFLNRRLLRPSPASAEG